VTERPEHPELDGSDLELGDPLAEGVDMTALLTRRFAWDTTVCSQVPDLLTALGLVHGSPEGMDADHHESHERLAQVLPLESHLQGYSGVMATVLTAAILSTTDADISEDDELGYATQNAEIILASSRAMVAQLIYSGMLRPGPLFHRGMQMVFLEAEGE
jgi:hypothetical protein